VHCKKFNDFPSLVWIPAETGKSLTFFYSVLATHFAYVAHFVFSRDVRILKSM
jgi:hypothetical protein